MDLGDKLIAFRKRHGLLRNDLAKLLGVAHTTVIRWERKEVKPGVPLTKFAERFMEEHDAKTSKATKK